MKGIILAGGTGSRLLPLTRVTNKHLLPVYNKPMIYYPLFSLKEAGITDILIISGKGNAGDFLELLGSGSKFGLKLSFEVQEEAGGIAQAIGMAERFANNEKIAVVLGDNIFEDSFKDEVKNFASRGKGAKIFLKKVNNPQSYGVATIDGGKITGIVEKPTDRRSDMAVVGLYMYEASVFDIIKTLTPSARNELEITDVNNHYLQNETLDFGVVNGFWGDCGESFESLYTASALVKDSFLAHISNELTIPTRRQAGLKPEYEDRIGVGLNSL